MITPEKQALLDSLRARVRIGVEMPEIEGLGRKKAAVLMFCRTRMLEDNRVPTVREVQAEFGLRSLSAAHAHLQDLRRLKLLPELKATIGLSNAEGQFLFDVIEDQKRQIMHLGKRRG
jgi:hypothetical protein